MAAVLLMRPLGIWGIWKKEKDVAARRHLLLEKWTVAEESHSTSNLTQGPREFYRPRVGGAPHGVAGPWGSQFTDIEAFVSGSRMAMA
jgi:hypothetical protein